MCSWRHIWRQLFTVNQMITMVFSKEDKILIKSLYETKGYGARKLLKEVPQKNWTKGGLVSLITKLRSTILEISWGSRVVADLGRHAPMKLSLKLQIWFWVKKDKPQTYRWTRQISCETGISRTTVMRIIHDDQLQWVISLFGSVFRSAFRCVLNSDWDQRSAKRWSRFFFVWT